MAKSGIRLSETSCTDVANKGKVLHLILRFHPIFCIFYSLHISSRSSFTGILKRIILICPSLDGHFLDISKKIE